jgi:hypothetical protein
LWLTYFYDLLTYLKTISAKVVMFGIKPKLMKCMFQLTYFYDLLTYLNTLGAKVVMFGIKPKLMKCRFVQTYFYDLLTYLSTIGLGAKVVMFGTSRPTWGTTSLRNCVSLPLAQSIAMSSRDGCYLAMGCLPLNITNRYFILRQWVHQYNGHGRGAIDLVYHGSPLLGHRQACMDQRQ